MFVVLGLFGLVVVSSLVDLRWRLMMVDEWRGRLL
jgi:hypothetical protein